MGKQILNGVEYVTATTRGFPPLIYSNAEREVGVWIDGKPLYQKTIYISALPNNRIQSYSTNITNIDKVFIKDAWVYDFGAVNINRIATQGAGIGCWTYTSNNEIIISFETGVDRSTYDAYVTLCYTKTTDTAGSGKYSAVGDLMHHYSETEQVVGTWIDGKPVYEKIFNIASLPDTTTIEYDTSINNFGNWIDGECNGCVIFPSGNKSPLPYLNLTDMVQTSIKLQYNTNGKIQITTGMDRSNVSARFVLRYTKTID